MNANAGSSRLVPELAFGYHGEAVALEEHL